jgi:Leucine-rich repeat (LRR) protein
MSLVGTPRNNLLSYLKLKEIPFDTLDALETRKIVASHNELERLPVEIYAYKKLEALFLGDNLLRLLPVDMGVNLHALKILALNNNQLTTLAIERAHLDKLPLLENLVWLKVF